MRHTILLILLILALPLTLLPATNAEELALPLPGGDEAVIHRYLAGGDTALLWLPSSFGLQPPHHVLAQTLANRGIEVWLADLHTSYMVPTGRESIDAFRAEDLATLVGLLLRRKQQVILVSTGRGSKAALETAHYWQQRHPGDRRLSGAILFHPSLYAGRPGLGQDAQYLPIVHQTRLPLFIIQPEHSTTYMRLPSLMRSLEQAGSAVFSQTLAGAVDGFHARPDDHLGAGDRSARKRLPNLLAFAIRQLPGATLPSPAARQDAATLKEKDTPPGLRPYSPTDSLAFKPSLHLEDMNGKRHHLEDYRGKVVLLSFWASWCPPCVRELPSMNRLAKRLRGTGLRILAVNIGESKKDIQAFLREHPINFPVLLDTDRKAYADWKVYVVPSNFVLGADGVLRYGSAGAIDWEAKEVVETLESLAATTGSP